MIDTLGSRPAPTCRAEETTALETLDVAFTSIRPGAPKRSEDDTGDGVRGLRCQARVARGTILARSTPRQSLRLALRNRAGDRVAVGLLTGGRLTDIARTVAEALARAPAAAPDGASPEFSPETIGHVMRMRRNSRTPVLRGDGSIQMTVPGAYAVVNRSAVSVMADTGLFLRLSLEGAWQDLQVARVADAMLRDSAPQARHLTYTTEPRGRFFNESGSLIYDGSSSALCSCGWHYPTLDRSGARWAANWHRANPRAYSTE